MTRMKSGGSADAQNSQHSEVSSTNIASSTSSSTSSVPQITESRRDVQSNPVFPEQLETKSKTADVSETKEPSSANRGRRRVRSLTVALGGITNAIAGKLKRNPTKKHEQRQGSSTKHDKKQTAHRKHNGAYDGQHRHNDRRPHIHGFSTKDIRAKLRNIEFEDYMNGIEDPTDELAKENRKRQRHKMELIWNEYERLKIKFHELVKGNNASIESISNYGLGRSVSSTSSLFEGGQTGQTSMENEVTGKVDEAGNQKNLRYFVTQAMLDRLLLLVFYGTDMDGEKDFVSELLTRGADPNWSGPNGEIFEGRSALHVAAMNGHVECVDMLLHANANLVARDDRLQTPLHLACRHGRLAVVRNLVETGADIELEDRYGRTSIHEAFQALEVNSKRMAWFERTTESSAQESEFVHQLEIDEWIQELEKRLNNVDYNRTVLATQQKEMRKRERRRRKEEAKKTGVAEATNVLSMLTAVHGEDLPNMIAQGSGRNHDDENVLDKQSVVNKSRMSGITMEGIMQALSTKSQEALSMEVSSDEQSIVFESDSESDNEGPSKEKSKERAAEILTTEELMISQIESLEEREYSDQNLSAIENLEKTKKDADSILSTHRDVIDKNQGVTPQEQKASNEKGVLLADRPSTLPQRFKKQGRRPSHIFFVRDRSGSTLLKDRLEKYKGEMSEYRRRNILTSRPRNQRHVLNEIVSILIKRRSELDEMNGIEAAIRYLLHKDINNQIAFNKRAQRIWFLENKKEMEAVFADPFDKGYDSTVFQDPRSMVALNYMWTKRVKNNFILGIVFFMIYTFILCYVTISLGARNARQVPAVERAIKQKFMDTEWDEYNAETFADIESPSEWWKWLENVALPNLYSPIGVAGQNNIEAVGDVTPAEMEHIDKTRGRGNMSYPFHAKSGDPRIRTRRQYMGGYASFLGPARLRQVRALATPCQNHMDDGKLYTGEDNLCLDWPYWRFTSESMQQKPKYLNWGTPYVAKFEDYGVDMNIVEDIVFDLDSMMGKLGKIPNGGYALEIDMQNKTAAYEMVHALKNAGYISLNTVAVILEFVLVNREINLITSSRFACEFSTSGYVITSFRMRSAKLSQWNEKHDALLLSLQFALYFIFIVRVCAWIRSICVLSPILSHIHRHKSQSCWSCNRRRKKGRAVDVSLTRNSTKSMLERSHSQASSRKEVASKPTRRWSAMESPADEHSGHNQVVEDVPSNEFGCCCFVFWKCCFRSVCKPASREARMNKLQQSGGYMVELPCFKFTQFTRMHRWDSEGRISPYMQAYLFAKNEDSVLASIKRGSCAHSLLRNCAQFALICCRCPCCKCCAGSGGKSQKGKRRIIGCCECNGLDSNLRDFLESMNNDRLTPIIVESKYYFKPCPYSQTISRGYGSFVCQSKLWEITLLLVYVFLVGLHVREIIWFRDIDLERDFYDDDVEASIFYSQVRVILLGILSTFTLFEFMVWISKLYRTTAVLFMVVEEMFVRVFKFLILMLFAILAFMMLRYSIFGMEIGIHGLGDYFFSPFKELNGENTLDEVSTTGNNIDIENAIDTVFILFMVLLMANLLIAFMADGYGELTTSGYSRYAYNQFEQIKLTRFASYKFDDAVETIEDMEKKMQLDRKINGNRYHLTADTLQEIENFGYKAKRKRCNKCSFAVLRGFMY